MLFISLICREVKAFKFDRSFVRFDKFPIPKFSDELEMLTESIVKFYKLVDK